MRDRIKNIVSIVLGKFVFEPSLGNVASVLKHQIEVSMDSIILADYSVSVDQSASQNSISGTISYKESHEDNRFEVLHFSVSTSDFTIN